MLSKARKEDERDGDGGAGIVTGESKGKKETVSEVKGVSLYYTREVGNMMGGIFSRSTHHVNVYEQAAHSRKKCMSYGDMFSRLRYEGHGKPFVVDR